MALSYRQMATLTRQLTLLAAALLLLLYLVTLYFYPSCQRQPNTILLGLHVLPLLCFIPAILRGNVRSYIWLCFLLLGYFLVAVPNAVGCVTVLNVLEPVLIGLLFSVAMMYVRWRSRELKGE